MLSGIRVLCHSIAFATGNLVWSQTNHYVLYSDGRIFFSNLAFLWLCAKILIFIRESHSQACMLLLKCVICGKVICKTPKTNDSQ